MDSALKALEATHTSQRTCRYVSFTPFLSDSNEGSCCKKLISATNPFIEADGGASEEYCFYSNDCSLLLQELDSLDLVSIDA